MNWRRTVDHVKDFMVLWGAIIAVGGALVTAGFVNWPPFAMAQEFREFRQMVEGHIIGQLRRELYQLEESIARIRGTGETVPLHMRARRDELRAEITRLTRLQG